MQKLIFLRIGLVLNLLEDASLLSPLRHNGAKIQIPKKVRFFNHAQSIRIVSRSGQLEAAIAGA